MLPFLVFECLDWPFLLEAPIFFPFSKNNQHIFVCNRLIIWSNQSSFFLVNTVLVKHQIQSAAWSSCAHKPWIGNIIIWINKTSVKVVQPDNQSVTTTQTHCKCVIWACVCVANTRCTQSISNVKLYLDNHWSQWNSHTQTQPSTNLWAPFTRCK